MLRAALLILAFAGVTAMSPSVGEAKEIKVRITAGEHTMIATFLDNATARALAARFPLTLPMTALYRREMVYRFPEPLPANESSTSGYEVGDIVYWTPRHSFVIMYEQNGEIISNLQKIGRIDSGVEVFKRTGNIDVTFDLMEK